MIKAKILKHSKNIQGDEVITYELLFPRIILSEVNTHREASRNTSSCLSGDTLITFDLPTKRGNERYKNYKMRIDDFCNKYLNGIKRRKRHNYQVFLEDKEYTAKEIAKIVGKNPTNIRRRCRDKTIKVLNPNKKKTEDFIINGLDYNFYHNGYEIKNTSNRYKNMLIRVLNEDTGEFISSKVSDVFVSGIKDIYEIELDNGYRIKCTDKHKIFTDSGWKTLEDINIQVINGKTCYDSHSFKVATNGVEITKEFLQKQIDLGKSLKDFCKENNLNFKQISTLSEKWKLRWRKKLLKDEKLLYKDYSWLKEEVDNGMFFPQIATLCNSTVDRVKKQARRFGIKGNTHTWGNMKTWNKGLKYKLPEASLVNIRAAAKKRVKNGSYKNYRNYNTKTIRFSFKVRYNLIENNKYFCCITGSRQKLHLHHIDPVWHNPEREFDPTNIIPIHRDLHKILHAKHLDLEFLKWYEEGKDLTKFFECYEDVTITIDDIKKPKPKKTYLICKYYPIKNIKYVGKEETYDLEVEGKYHNFIANGIVVHNSRAVPFKKMVEMVQNTPFTPIAWQKHHKGMQGSEYETNESEITLNEQEWLNARDNAIEVAERLYEEGKVTKQLCNRLLEPFMWTRMIFTIGKKGLKNLFNLRCPRYKYDNGYGEPTFFFSKKEWEEVNKWKGSTDGSEGLDKKIATPKDEFEWKALNEGQAEIHFMELAEQMYDAYKESRPQILGNNEWHIPFEEEIINQFPLSSLGERIKISAVMCARTSYTVIEEGKKKTKEQQLALYDKLLEEKHCFTEGTEVLTLTGWKDFSILTYEDKIATINTKTGNFIGFNTPTNIIKEEYEGEIYQYPNGFEMTPNHKLIGKVISKQKDRRSTYNDLEVYALKDIKGNVKKENALRPQILFSAANPSIEIKKNKDYYEGCLIGFFLGDGSCKKNEKTKFRLKRERKIIFLEKILKELKINYKKNIDKNNISCFYCEHYGMHKYYDEKRKKFIPENILIEQIENTDFLIGLFEGLKNSDGSIKRKTWSYSTKSEKLAENILHIAPIIGLTGKRNKTFKGLYKISFTTNNKILINDSRKPTYKTKKIHYKGKIYCVDVNCNGILVRKGNETMLSHNSSPLEHPCKTMTNDVYKTFVRGPVMKNEHDDTFITKKENSGWCYNLKGFMSLRYIIENVKE